MKQILLLTCTLAILATPAVAKPLKVYIMAGQSNMVGHAKASTLPAMGKDAKTKPLMEAMVAPDGKPLVLESTYIKYVTFSGYAGRDGPSEKQGKLTVGFGGDPKSKDVEIGPELAFGISMQKHLNEPILIIKTAWGGKDLYCDFRSPSAGQPANPLKPKFGKKRDVGAYYRLMIESIQATLKNPEKVYPNYDPKEGFEIAGFVWFQGFNDMVSSEIYPNRMKPGGFAKYSELLAHFIRDVRKDLRAPNMRFVIGVIGVDGEAANRPIANLRPAMAAPAQMPEFKGNVSAVMTEKYWDNDLGALSAKKGEVGKMARLLRTKSKHGPNKDGTMDQAAQKAYLEKLDAKLLTAEDREQLKGASDAAYHYLGSAKILSQIGQAFAEAMVEKTE